VTLNDVEQKKVKAIRDIESIVIWRLRWEWPLSRHLVSEN